MLTPKLCMLNLIRVHVYNYKTASLQVSQLRCSVSSPPRGFGGETEFPGESKIRGESMPDMDMARYISVQNIKFVAQIEVWSPKVGSVPPNQDILQILHAGAAFGRRPQSFEN